MPALAYSHEVEIPAFCATAAKVIAVPAWSSSCNALIALERVSSPRRRAAAMIPAVLPGAAAGVSSDGIGGHLLPAVIVALQRDDDLFEIAGDLPVHLC